MVRTTHTRALTALATALVGTAACHVPDFQGPQIQSPPPAFTIRSDAYQERRMFPQDDLLHHDAWVEASWGNFSGIYINGHPGSFGRDRAEEARQGLMAIPVVRPTQVKDFSALEPITIDGRQAFGWSEMVRSTDKGIEYVAYRAMIPYDTITYAVEFISGEPSFKSRPDSLRTIVASFAVGKTTANLPLILILSGVGLLVVARMRARAKERSTRLAGINLVQMPRDEDGDEDDPFAFDGVDVDDDPERVRRRPAPGRGTASRQDEADARDGPEPPTRAASGAAQPAGAKPPPKPRPKKADAGALSLAEAIARQRDRAL